MRLGFDLDEVVVDLTSEFENFLEIEYGIKWPIDYFCNYNFAHCRFHEDDNYNKQIIKDMYRVANDADFQFQAEPFDEARKVLHKLKRLGHKLYFLTSRPTQNQPLTFRWLRQNDIPFDVLEVLGKQPKGPLGLKYKLDMYVDDLEKHLDSMWSYKKSWRKGLLLLDKPWNSNSLDGSKFKRVKNWKEILRHVGVQNR